MKNYKYAVAVGYLQESLTYIRHLSGLDDKVKNDINSMLERTQNILDEKVCEQCGYWGGCDSTGDVRTCYHRDVYSDTDLINTWHLDSCPGFLRKNDDTVCACGNALTGDDIVINKGICPECI